MTKFIELTFSGQKQLVNISDIKEISKDSYIKTRKNGFKVEESYEEIKSKLYRRIL